MRNNGLTSSEVEKSREEYGSNVIPESEPTTFWDEFKETFNDPMIRILLVIAAIMIGMFCLGYAEIYEPLGTIVAVFIVAFVTAKTGVASDTSYRNLKASIKKDEIKTYRDGELHQIVIDDLVVGDYILVQSGDKIPADGILVSGSIKVNNSALNGEPEDCRKEPTDESDDIPENITGDTFVDKHSLFRGAVVTDGEGVMLIKKVGLKTMMGKMAEEMQEEEPDSPLRVKLSKLANQISTFGYVGAVVIALFMMAFKIFSAGGFEQYMLIGGQNILMDVIDAVSLAIVIIVCAVPEGLPLMISLVLMQNTSKMLDHNVLVRKAIGIETSGSLNILYSDKTGTITKGELEVVEFFTADGVTHDKLNNYKGSDEIYKAIALNTQSAFDSEHNVVGGNVTDKALLKFIGEDEYNSMVNSTLTIDNTQGFNSANKFSQIHIKEDNKVYYKGAPERLIEKAKYILDENGVKKELDIDKLNDKINELAEKAMRVLAFGYSESEFSTNTINDDLVITGLVGIRDDVRPDAKIAIDKIQKAGVQLVMITGDKMETARAIARDAGLIKDEDKDLVLTSAQLNDMSDDEVKGIIPKIRVMARALPTDKSRMVRLSQELNLVTGMTGDGVNDSPALKLADVGFAMGSGTDVAKEASKIVIIDDSLTSIADAIWYGRTIYHNILKFCNFQLVINVCAVIVSAIAPFFGVEEPLKVTHLLFVNLVMDSLGAIMLGNEPALEKYMTEKPRKRDESIINASMASKIAVEGLYLVVLSFFYLKAPFIKDLFTVNGEYFEAQHITGYFVLFIISALFNCFHEIGTIITLLRGLMRILVS